VMIRFMGPAIIVLALSFALVACNENPGAYSAGTGSSGLQSGADPASNTMGFNPSKLGAGGGGGGTGGAGGGGGGGY
jgi:hypothetical protein